MFEPWKIVLNIFENTQKTWKIFLEKWQTGKGFKMESVHQCQILTRAIQSKPELKFFISSCVKSENQFVFVHNLQWAHEI